MTAPFAATADRLIGDLTALRARRPDCRLVAYCDLDARLVLRHAAHPTIRQEVLDRLSEEAHQAFGLSQRVKRALPPELLPPHDSHDAQETPEGIRLIDDRGVRLFLRVPTAPQDALILLCQTPDGAEALLPEAERLLLGMQLGAGAGTA
ncbi:hypothetical protein [Tritonibacter horizontis]|uniref:Roadblock/LAMTOR2 domain-containing protein n=1 Tax=Tritonibacter horizontis TaxID=1768241 RepID=A0A132C099_9RHOB|nr:hypothetical protein [Tritonibacter horizontis]KUP94011.1 hypothetical protein TRIHO_11920 [Tritonibacter horizontis]